MLSQHYHCVGGGRYHKAPLWLAFFVSLFPFKLALSFLPFVLFSRPLFLFLSPPLMCQFLQPCPGVTQANPGQQANGKQQHCTHINMTRQLFVYQPGVKHNKAGWVYHRRDPYNQMRLQHFILLNFLQFFLPVSWNWCHSHLFMSLPPSSVC